ncbi:hypothetical protein BCR36DRAFT_368868 [Piromyces finnis]|uniref:Uncharacterized protein n=1 Tax=Piromyces finnis TaxID=1754191 RepID=A0A1Y1VFX0_9FUNG|nr:hypothetical protein BCR36DRAFT_368868 [Piromyces finnis]|eukprot:ORX53851.1 hypothetical protein BCR36DRAFT_368868 [Piromyces finnis]
MATFSNELVFGELLGFLCTKYYENKSNRLNNKFALDKLILDKKFEIVDNDVTLSPDPEIKSNFEGETFYKDLAIKCLTSAFVFHYEESIENSNYKKNLKPFLEINDCLDEHVRIKSILGYMVKVLTDEDVDTGNKYNHINKIIKFIIMSGVNTRKGNQYYVDFDIENGFNVDLDANMSNLSLNLFNKLIKNINVVFFNMFLNN